MESVDADVCIARDAGMPIPKIFELEGEEGFRAREFVFLHTMFEYPRCILSCGGGVIVHKETRALLRQLGTVVYLKVDADEAVSRISSPETRPMLSQAISPAEILASRLQYYEEVADVTVDTRGYSLYEVTFAVQHALRVRGILPPQERIR
jgi:shikimate kinase